MTPVRLPTANPVKAQAWCQALFSQLQALGVSHVAISPGSRSTPLTVAADRTSGLKTSIHLDERAGSFFALGLAKATNSPVALISTSGTAVANYLPAIIESFNSGVPLVVITADRPPELQNRGAPQTIDQTHIYGTHVRLFKQAPVAGTDSITSAAKLAIELLEHACGKSPGPVHLNCPLREPLEPTLSNSFFAPIQTTAITNKPSRINKKILKKLTNIEKGLIVAGPMNLEQNDITMVAEMSRRTGWPILADPISGMRCGPHTRETPIIATGEFLLSSHWIDNNKPDVIVQIGAMPTSKSYRLWLEKNPIGRLVAVDNLGRHSDPTYSVTDRINAKPRELASALISTLSEKPPTSWMCSWLEAEEIAAKTIARIVAEAPFDEPGIVNGLNSTLPSGAQLIVANSMPIRDLDAFLPSRNLPMKITANRGANGIDGTISTATGFALGGHGPTVVFLGDLALLHDLSGLASISRLGVDLTVVVADNNGGGIFSFLPVSNANHIDYQRLFHTPHDLEISNIAPFVRAEMSQPNDPKTFARALEQSINKKGFHLIHVKVDALTNVEIHRKTSAAVKNSLSTK